MDQPEGTPVAGVVTPPAEPVRDIGAVIPIVASDISSDLEPEGVAPVGIIVGCAIPIVASS